MCKDSKYGSISYHQDVTLIESNREDLCESAFNCKTH